MYPFRRVEDALLENDDEGVPTANGSATGEGYLQRAPSTRRNYLFLGISSTLRPVTNRLKPVLNVLRCLGYFPGFLGPSGTRKHRTIQLSLYSILTFLSVGFFVLNLYLFKRNVDLLLKYHEKFGFLHATTVSSIITGIKPFINMFFIAFFALRVRPHLKMLRLMNSVQLSFRSAFGRCPPLTRYNFSFILAVLCTGTVPLAYRIYESISLNKSQPRDFAEWLTDPSFVIVPLLSVWNVVPLFYYILCNRVVCFWCRLLKESLKSEHQKRRFSLKFYYEQFLRIATVQKAIGSLFNPFILFSLAWSLIMLCLTIYFITQPTSSLSEPITELQIRSEHIRMLLTERVRLNLGWSALQITVALVHICAICSTGMRTNEETRKILSAVLTIVPDANADLDRFQISCFVHKMSTQYMWGMTVWRAFPLERATFFTLVSVIITYSFLLVKLKDNSTLGLSLRASNVSLAG